MRVVARPRGAGHRIRRRRALAGPAGPPLDSAEASRQQPALGLTLLDAVGALVCILDGEGRVVQLNQACERVTGYGVAELCGRPFWETLIPADEREQAERDFRRDVAGHGSPEVEESVWITKGGARRVLRWSPTIVRDDAGDCVLAVAAGLDVTELRLVERRLAEQERCTSQATFLERAGTALDGAFGDPDQLLSELARLAVPYLGTWCAVRVEEQGTIVRTRAIAHVDPEKERRLWSILGLFDAPASLSLPLPIERGRSWVANGGASCIDTFLAGLPKRAAPTRAHTRGALELAGMTSFMVVPLVSRSRILGSMTFGLADPSREYGGDHLVLAQTLAARAALALDNAVLYREAQEAAKAREDFLVVASHELRTPLTTLRLAVGALLQRERTAEAGACPDALLHGVERSTQRLCALVDDLLDISRLTSDPPAPVLEEVDLYDVAADVIETSAELLRCAASTVELRHHGSTSGRWDRQWLCRIVSNLLSNAAKYGAARPIEIDVEGGDDLATIRVRDHGIGIAREEQARIFQRFERAVSVRHYGGFGLGLWIVRKMAEALGGSVRVESRPGAGAAFTVELPRRGPEEPAGFSGGLGLIRIAARS